MNKNIDTTILSIFDNPKDFLLEEDKNQNNNKLIKCPEINIKINNIETTALIDTGSRVSCISEDFYRNNIEAFKDSPKLPLTGIQAIGFNGAKSNKLKIQIMANITLKTLSENITVLVIPKLIKNCIIGIDSLKKLKITIDTDKDIIYFDKNSKKLSFNYSNLINDDKNSIACANLIAETCVLTGNSVGPVLQEGDFPTETEIDNKIEYTEGLSPSQKIKLKNLLVKYSSVFNKNTGRLKNYSYEFKLKDTETYFKKTYPVPTKYVDKVKEQIDKMLKNNILELSESNYINPICVVLKKMGI